MTKPTAKEIEWAMDAICDQTAEPGRMAEILVDSPRMQRLIHDVAACSMAEVISKPDLNSVLEVLFASNSRSLMAGIALGITLAERESKESKP